MDMTRTLQDSGEHDTKPYNLNILSKSIKVLLFWIFLILFPSASKYAIHHLKGLVQIPLPAYINT